MNQLKQKHPQGKNAVLEVLLTDTPKQVDPIKFDTIEADLVKRAAVRIKVAAGSSGSDANDNKTVLQRFHLFTAIGEVIKNLHIADNLSSLLKVFLAIRLIPLDKNLGFRPIGIGKILRWIAGKFIVSYVRKDLVLSLCSLQICTVHEAGCEWIINSVHKIHEIINPVHKIYEQKNQRQFYQ